MQKKTCCFTGHRNILSADREVIACRLEKTIVELIHAGIDRFVAGGARGFDTLAAQAVLQLRKRYPDIKLILALPCLTQTRGWSTKNIAVYETIKSQADEIVYISQDYTRGCMYKRNRYLVDSSGICVCFWNREKGGTAYTVHYAEKKGLKIINIAQPPVYDAEEPEANG
ncbi:MAG: DUF1273 domain-containing protein [Oscillospiraceae bacterium]|nr:DUF1273 domain-containing protein [Oscillospiraceae bacterium]